MSDFISGVYVAKAEPDRGASITATTTGAT